MTTFRFGLSFGQEIVAEIHDVVDGDLVARVEQLGNEQAAAHSRRRRSRDTLSELVIVRSSNCSCHRGGSASVAFETRSLSRPPSRRVEHLHRLERVLVEVLADQRELVQDVVGHGDDVAADLVGLEDVEQLARACPDQFRLRVASSTCAAGHHVRHRIDAGVGDAAGEYRTMLGGRRQAWPPRGPGPAS